MPTLILPSWEPDATISESLEIARAITALSCIMNLSSAWYCRSFFNLPVTKSPHLRTCTAVGQKHREVNYGSAHQGLALPIMSTGAFERTHTEMPLDKIGYPTIIRTNNLSSAQ